MPQSHILYDIVGVGDKLKVTDAGYLSSDTGDWRCVYFKGKWNGMSDLIVKCNHGSVIKLTG